jgi:hypothetical protein
VETRLYFVLGDLAANAATGALVGGVAALVFGPSWNMWLAMLAGMALGMLFGLPLAVLLGAFFGAMEVMIPVMTTGMLAGMWVSMAASANDLAFSGGARQGGLCGVGVMVASYLANAWIRSRASRWTS